MHLVAELLPEVGELLDRQFVVGIEFSGLEALDRGRAVLGRIEDHGVELHVGGIVKLRVLDDLDVIVRHPLGEDERSVGDEIAGLGPVGAKAFDGGPMHRIGRLMRQHLEEIGRRRIECDFECLRVDRASADLLRAHLACIDRLGILHDVEHRGVFGGGRRVLQSPEGVNEVIGCDGIAV